jgi:phage anti-repressor protein
MQGLKVIENELVPVYETSTGEKVVYGSELHEILGVKSNYRDWVKNRLNDCEAIENEDFQIFAKNLAKGRPAQDHIIKLDTAKEMAMLERNEKGKQVRRYFIGVEKKYKAQIGQRDKGDKLHIMEMNARSRMAQTYLKLAQIETLSPTYKNVLASKASEVLAGEPVIPLPKIEHRKVYTAQDIGDIFGISANKVGRIANQHNLKTEENGEYRRDKSKHSAHECDLWVYFDTVIPKFKRLITKEKEQMH